MTRGQYKGHLLTTNGKGGRNSLWWGLERRKVAVRAGMNAAP